MVKNEYCIFSLVVIIDLYLLIVLLHLLHIFEVKESTQNKIAHLNTN